MNLPDDDAKMVKKMLDYLYLLDYESDENTGLCIASTYLKSIEQVLNTDVEYDEKLDFQMCVKIMRLQSVLSYYEVTPPMCYEALNQNNQDYDKTLASPEDYWIEAFRKCNEWTEDSYKILGMYA